MTEHTHLIGIEGYCIGCAMIESREKAQAKPQHKINGVLGGTGAYGVTHDYDCPACVARADANLIWRRENNPHRPGTKAFAKWEREMRAADWGCDPRGERYWCM